ncbi:hypothetical protein [Domibacillus enclensis]|uniref:Uncharacterized protein n=1 Tax=Domibacillus enclensis TaxID=1017273 RepID=A0A1N6WGI0_9BACI|nr:hypothetical protein [Domibacillus enclensis]OXS77929.1 hypothetical protein B1B05_10005 [Domibacillus enclensis]SIQ89277.1 hypothetical protein SAMN05443094_104161 [Domibacillus enclensis]
MKKFILAGCISLGAAALAGCEEGTIHYQGEQMPVSEAEERIADQLEVENPDMDLELSIYSETDD